MRKRMCVADGCSPGCGGSSGTNAMCGPCSRARLRDGWGSARAAAAAGERTHEEPTPSGREIGFGNPRRRSCLRSHRIAANTSSARARPKAHTPPLYTFAFGYFTLFLRITPVQRIHSQRMHTHTCERTRANLTPISIFKDWKILGPSTMGRIWFVYLNSKTQYTTSLNY